MMTARRACPPGACPPAPGPLEQYAATFDDLFVSVAQRRGVRECLTSLSDDDRDQIGQAITVIRQTRQTVTLGMPGLRSPTAGQE
jgi:hypothetical protein